MNTPNRDYPPEFRTDEIVSERLGETPADEAPERHPLTGGKGDGAATAPAVGVGAALGAVAGGAVAGSLAAGPIGTVVGAALGALAGGFGGKAMVDHNADDEAYWRDRLNDEPYFVPGMTYQDYAPAYALGREWRGRYPSHSFEDIEPEVAKDYERVRGSSPLEWHQARHASLASWDRMSV